MYAHPTMNNENYNNFFKISNINIITILCAMEVTVGNLVM